MTDKGARTGALVKTVAVTGKVDGLTADPARGRLIATVNGAAPRRSPSLLVPGGLPTVRPSAAS